MLIERGISMMIKEIRHLQNIIIKKFYIFNCYKRYKTRVDRAKSRS